LWRASRVQLRNIETLVATLGLAAASWIATADAMGPSTGFSPLSDELAKRRALP